MRTRLTHSVFSLFFNSPFAVVFKIIKKDGLGLKEEVVSTEIRTLQNNSGPLLGKGYQELVAFVLTFCGITSGRRAENTHMHPQEGSRGAGRTAKEGASRVPGAFHS